MKFTRFIDYTTFNRKHSLNPVLVCFEKYRKNLKKYFFFETSLLIDSGKYFSRIGKHIFRITMMIKENMRNGG